MMWPLPLFCLFRPNDRSLVCVSRPRFPHNVLHARDRNLSLAICLPPSFPVKEFSFFKDQSRALLVPNYLHSSSLAIFSWSMHLPTEGPFPPGPIPFTCANPLSSAHSLAPMSHLPGEPPWIVVLPFPLDRHLRLPTPLFSFPLLGSVCCGVTLDPYPLH